MNDSDDIYRSTMQSAVVLALDLDLRLLFLNQDHTLGYQDEDYKLNL